MYLYRGLPGVGFLGLGYRLGLGGRVWVWLLWFPVYPPPFCLSLRLF